MKTGKYLVVSVLICLLFQHSGSQTNPSQKAILFFGSTACDAYIRKQLNIPDSENCEFIKWELTLSNNSTYQISILHGEGQPNSNGFKGGGTRNIINGKYAIKKNTNGVSYLQVYALSGDKLESPIVLLAMDENIFHLADDKLNFLVGNGGWGYVLNRVKE